MQAPNSTDALHPCTYVWPPGCILIRVYALNNAFPFTIAWAVGVSEGSVSFRFRVFLNEVAEPHVPPAEVGRRRPSRLKTGMARTF